MPLEPQNLTALAQAAATAVRDIDLAPEYSASLLLHIERGYPDAIAATILAWCTRLTHWSITVPVFLPSDVQDFHVLMLAKQAITRLLADVSHEELPFRNVRDLELQHSNRHHGVYYEHATMFLCLPKIKSLVAYGLCDLGHLQETFIDAAHGVTRADIASHYIMHVPDQESTVKELVLADAGLVSAGLSTFLIGIRSLKKLTLQLSPYIMQGEIPDREEVAEDNLGWRGSLAELDLQIDPREYFLNSNSLFLDNEPLAEGINENLCHFNRLRRLSCSMTYFFTAASANNNYKISIVLSKLPESIEYLQPRCPDLIASWVSKDVFVEPYIEGFIELLNATSPGQRFHSIKVLDLSETFVDDPDTFDIGRLKSEAASHAVELLLCQT